MYLINIIRGGSNYEDMASKYDGFKQTTTV
jgi:hypothetical protein